MSNKHLNHCTFYKIRLYKHAINLMNISIYRGLKKLKLFLCLTNYYAMKAYGEVDV
jgi:hypothetical protein